MNDADIPTDFYDALRLLFFRAQGHIDQLPDEILLRMFKSAAGTEPFWTYEISKPSKEAYNLCLVSRRLSAPAHEVLYTNVVIQENDDLYSPIWTKFFNSPLAASKCKKLTLSCKFLDENGNLAIPSNETPGRDTEPFDYAIANLYNLVCLEDSTQWLGPIDTGRLSIRKWFPERFLRSSNAHYSSLTVLMTDHLRFEEFTFAANAFPSLRHLLIRGVLTVEDALCLESGSAFKDLVELHAAAVIGNEEGLHRFFGCPTALGILSIGMILPAKPSATLPWPADDLASLLQALQRQQSLKYLVLPETRVWNLSQHAHPLDMSNFPHLHTLYMHPEDNMVEMIGSTGFNFVAPILSRLIFGVWIDNGRRVMPSESKLTDFMNATVHLLEASRASMMQNAESVLSDLKADLLAQNASYDVLKGSFRTVLAAYGINLELHELHDKATVWTLVADPLACAQDLKISN